MKVLVALNYMDDDGKFEKTLKEIYAKATGDELDISFAYYLKGIEIHLANHPDTDTLILFEDLEQNNPVSVNFLDSLSDRYPHLNILLMVNDSHKDKKDGYINKLFALGIYNAIYYSDANYNSLVELLANPRNKKSAKVYLEIEEPDEIPTIDDADNTAQIPEEQQESIFRHLREADENTIGKLFDSIVPKYSEKQVMFLVSVMPVSIKDKLRTAKNEAFLYYEDRIRQINEKIKEREKELEEKEKELENTKIKVKREVVTKEKIIVKQVAPDDYKKVIGFIGSPGAGTTTIINLVASNLAANRKKVALLDTTRNRDLYMHHVFLKSDEELSVAEARYGLQYLFESKDVPVSITENISLYTSPPGKEIKGDMLTALDTLRKYNIILIDMDKEYDDFLLRLLDKLFIVQDMDFSSYPYISELLMRVKKAASLDKARIIVNKYIKCDYNIKDIMENNGVHIDFLTGEQNKILDDYKKLEYFIVPYLNVDDYKKLCELNINIADFPEEIKDSISKISEEIYPIEIKKSLFSRLFNRVLGRQKVVSEQQPGGEYEEQK